MPPGGQSLHSHCGEAKFPHLYRSEISSDFTSRPLSEANPAMRSERRAADGWWEQAEAAQCGEGVKLGCPSDQPPCSTGFYILSHRCASIRLSSAAGCHSDEWMACQPWSWVRRPSQAPVRNHLMACCDSEAKSSQVRGSRTPLTSTRNPLNFS